jgi:hypothetical protein
LYRCQAGKITAIGSRASFAPPKFAEVEHQARLPNRNNRQTVLIKAQFFFAQNNLLYQNLLFSFNVTMPN